MKVEFERVANSDFEMAEAVKVNGQTIGTFVTTEEGWGCQYIDSATKQTIDFGDADYDVAKKHLVALIHNFN